MPRAHGWLSTELGFEPLQSGSRASMFETHLLSQFQRSAPVGRTPCLCEEEKDGEDKYGSVPGAGWPGQLLRGNRSSCWGRSPPVRLPWWDSPGSGPPSKQRPCRGPSLYSCSLRVLPLVSSFVPISFPQESCQWGFWSLFYGAFLLAWPATHFQLQSRVSGSSVEAMSLPWVSRAKPRAQDFCCPKLWVDPSRPKVLGMKCGSDEEPARMRKAGSLRSPAGPGALQEGSIGEGGVHIVGGVMETCGHCSSWHHFCVHVRWHGDDVTHQNASEPGPHRRAWSQLFESWRATGTAEAGFSIACTMFEAWKKKTWLGNSKVSHKINV